MNNYLKQTLKKTLASILLFFFLLPIQKEFMTQIKTTMKNHFKGQLPGSGF